MKAQGVALNYADDYEFCDLRDTCYPEASIDFTWVLELVIYVTEQSKFLYSDWEFDL